MVSKAKSVKGSSKGIGYIQSDKELGDALELDRNGIISREPKDILQEFRMLQDVNVKCEKNTISMVISPSEERQFTNPELREIGQKHLKALGLDNNQYLMTVHKSTGKPHIHILANRINEKGKALNDSMISKKSQEYSEKLAKEMGLRTAKDIQKVNEIAIKPIKQDINNAHQFAAKKAYDYQEYKDLMQSKGCIVKDTINKKGELQGFRITHKQSGLDFKASQIGKNVGLVDLAHSRVELPAKVVPSVTNAVYQVAKFLAKQASREAGIGY